MNNDEVRALALDYAMTMGAYQGLDAAQVLDIARRFEAYLTGHGDGGSDGAPVRLKEAA